MLFKSLSVVSIPSQNVRLFATFCINKTTNFFRLFLSLQRLNRQKALFAIKFQNFYEVLNSNESKSFRDA